MKRVCDRCKQKPNMMSVSHMNTDFICVDCKKAEQVHPMYHVAQAANHAARVAGDYDYLGLFAGKIYPF